MKTYLDEIIKDKLIVCPACQNDLMELSQTTIRCLKCGSHWPVRNAVPDFFNQYKEQRNICEGYVQGKVRETDKQLAELIINRLELNKETTYKAIQDIVFRARFWSCSDNCLSAEIQELKDRFFPNKDVVYPETPPGANNVPEVYFERHYFPNKMVSKTQATANVRVKNIGHYYWSSRVKNPIYLSLCWENPKGAGIDLPVDRVPFPIDIEPGRSISVPVKTSIPSRRGQYRLKASLYLGDSRLVAKSLNFFEIEVVNTSNERLKAGFREKQEIQPIIQEAFADYAQDHAQGFDLLKKELKKRGPSVRILEIGSGSSPQTAWIPDGKVIALDISSPLLELGSLFSRKNNLEPKLAFICANALYLPFKEQCFDAVVLFSTLHHFPQPEAVLKKITRVLKKDGFIAVLCEPVSQTLKNSETVQCLLKGINEQVFSWQEYLHIFKMAHLKVELLRIDGGSLKSFLTLEKSS